jgi:hypothetical protein
MDPFQLVLGLLSIVAVIYLAREVIVIIRRNGRRRK